MSGRTKLVIGNWKMNFTVRQAVTFAGKLAAKSIPEGVTVGIAPQSLAINEIATMLQKTELKLVAQNAYFKDEGAFTGEVSMPMLRGLCDFVLVGHSERRHIFHESNEAVREKVAAAVRSGITPILCVGETLIEREHYHTNHILHEQITVGLANLTADEVSKMVIAYEPVWAIGTGKFAHPEEASVAVVKIRENIASLYGAEIAAKIKVLYGGSVTKENALSYLKEGGIDGLLVGGASLGVSTFWPIVEAAAKAIPTQIAVKKNR